MVLKDRDGPALRPVYMRARDNTRIKPSHGKYEIVAQPRVMMKRHTPLRRTQRSSELWPRREVSKGSWGADKEAEI